MSMSHLTKREAMAIPAGLLFAFYLFGAACTAPAVIASGSADQIVRILFLLLFQIYLLAEILFSKESLAAIPAFALTLLTPAAALVVAMYCILVMFRQAKKLSPHGKIVAMIVSMYLLVCAVMVVSRVVMPGAYQQIMTVRSDSLDGRSSDVANATLINNWIGGNNTTSLPLFLINYLINALRMMLPFELAVRSLQYLPFFFFQLAVTVYLAHLFGKISEIEDEVQLLAVAVFLGYLLASVIFEPDFGSWVRHESATFPVLHLLVMSRNQRIREWKVSHARHAELPRGSHSAVSKG